MRPRKDAGGGWTRPNTPRELTPDEKAEFLRVVRVTAREMGASPLAARVLQRWADRESQLGRWTIHIKPADVRAATSTAARERVAVMGRTFGPEWSYGRGPYGMQPSYFLRRWSYQAPLDVLCDPVAATVIAVWAARDHQRECARAGWGRSLLVATRRWGSGHCSPREKDARTLRYWRARGVDPFTELKWGSKWPQDTTDRESILTYMREKIEDEALDLR